MSGPGEGWPSNFRGWEVGADPVKPWRWFDEMVIEPPRMKEADLPSMGTTCGLLSGVAGWRVIWARLRGGLQNGMPWR